MRGVPGQMVISVCNAISEAASWSLAGSSPTAAASKQPEGTTVEMLIRRDVRVHDASHSEVGASDARWVQLQERLRLTAVTHCHSVILMHKVYINKPSSTQRTCCKDLLWARVHPMYLAAYSLYASAK